MIIGANMPKERKSTEKMTHEHLVDDWKEIMISLGSEGKTQVHVQKALGISQPTFDRMAKEDAKFKEAVREFRQESAIYWTDLAQDFATGKNITPLANANVLKYNILNRSYIGWNDKQVVEQETTVKADKSATDLFKSMLESTKE